MRRGFTLIELLAVIVILAIIALIATPIVINIINDSKKESINRSIELYIDHVQKMVAKEQMKDLTFNPSKCEINEGNLTCDGKTIQIEMKGQTPKSGTIKFSKGMVIEGVNLELDNLYYQVKDDKVSEVTKEKIKSYSDYITKVSDADNDGKISSGDEYTYEVMDNMEEPYTFYVLSVEGDKVNLIMNSNICNDGSPVTVENKCTVRWFDWHDPSKSSCSGANGPIEIIDKLYNATKDWVNVQDIDMSGDKAYHDEWNLIHSDRGYGTIETTQNGIKITRKDGTESATIKYNNKKSLKARLPKNSEILETDCEMYEYYSNPEQYIGRGSCPLWLVENLQYYNSTNDIGYDKYSINNNSSVNQKIEGYWLMSSGSSLNNGNTDSAFLVSNSGTVGRDCANSLLYYGIRPVITVSLSDLS